MVKNQFDGGFRLVGPIDVNIAKVGNAEVARGFLNVLVANDVNVTGKVSVDGDVKVQGVATGTYGYGVNPVWMKVLQ
ncbi:MAG: hypothetical protein NTV51_21665 [Verrucomicrobia bacterium]|nr:hypothetical protein [Verrucomicrobiota bacterium]